MIAVLTEEFDRLLWGIKYLKMMLRDEKREQEEIDGNINSDTDRGSGTMKRLATVDHHAGPRDTDNRDMGRC